MKRVGNLIEQIADIDNLRVAYLKARKQKLSKREVWKFSQSIDEKLLQLRLQILNGNIKIGKYHFFKIFDPKERQICAASFSERIIQHAIMNICHSIFERHQINNSFACRKGKGAFKAVHFAHKYQKQYNWYLKLDYKKFFDSIDQFILMDQIKRLIKDKQLLMILQNIIFSVYQKTNKGVPIGNLTSQYFANQYLTKIDRFVYEKLKIPAYVRYMDDLVLWHSDKEALKLAFAEIKIFSENELKLQFKPICLNHTSAGLPFLGFLISRAKITLSNSRKQRFINKSKKLFYAFYKDEISETNLNQRLIAMYSFAQKSQSWRFRTKINQKYWASIEGFEPCYSWRQLEQQCQQLPSLESEQQQSGQQEQQYWVPPAPPPALR